MTGWARRIARQRAEQKCLVSVSVDFDAYSVETNLADQDNLESRADFDGNGSSDRTAFPARKRKSTASHVGIFDWMRSFPDAEFYRSARCRQISPGGKGLSVKSCDSRIHRLSGYQAEQGSASKNQQTLARTANKIAAVPVVSIAPRAYHDHTSGELSNA